MKVYELINQLMQHARPGDDIICNVGPKRSFTVEYVDCGSSGPDQSHLTNLILKEEK